MGQPQAADRRVRRWPCRRALLPLLASLPCTVRWIDSRENKFPAQIPSGVDKVLNDEVLEVVARMPAGSYFIVMNDNHQLDVELTAAILS
jgi:xanthine dehydrogenase accessory factor